MTSRVKKKILTVGVKESEHRIPMEIGYASASLQKTCEESRRAREVLPQGVAEMLPQRLSQLAAFGYLEEVPKSAPFFRYQLTENLGGLYAVRIDKRFRIVFKPVGKFMNLPDGTPDPTTATAIEIADVGDYHGA